jgi:site-specific recombinase XerD
MTQRKTLVTYIPTRVGTVRETNRPARGGVRVLIDGDRVKVQWPDPVTGLRRVESFPNTREDQAEAKAFALGIAETIARGPRSVAEELTLRNLWDRFEAAEFVHLREKTKKNYRANWLKWEVFLSKDAIAQDARVENLEALRASLTKQDYAIGQIHKTITDVKMVHAWGFRRELLSRNRLSLYRFKVGKDERPESPAEYSTEEREALIAACNPQHREHWRPWVAMMIANSQGSRMNAILHLQVPDVELSTGTVTWRARWDKNGRERTQPLTYGAYSAILTALWWKTRDGYNGPWIMYSSHERKRLLGKDPLAIYHPTSLERALCAAEKRAGVTHEAYRGMHGFRRAVAGDVLDATGDYKLALDWIDDQDLRMARKYLKRRSKRLESAARAIDMKGAVG